MNWTDITCIHTSAIDPEGNPVVLTGTHAAVIAEELVKLADLGPHLTPEVVLRRAAFLQGRATRQADADPSTGATA